jgi:predicted esterase
MRRLPANIVVVAWLVLPVVAAAQPDRFELGQRLRAFESAWDAHQPDAAARKRAVEPLKKAVASFFSQQSGEAGRSLDAARRALASAEAKAPEVRWAESLAFQPETRLLDAEEPELPFTLAAFYKLDGQPPTEAVLRVTLLLNGAASPGPAFTVPVKALPLSDRVPLQNLTEGDYQARVEILDKDTVLAASEQTVSCAARLHSRLGRLQKAVEALPVEPATTDQATLRGLLRLLETLAQRRTLETNYPAARLLAEAERAVGDVAAGRRFYGNKQPGQFWLTLAAGKGTAPVRLAAPEAVKTGEPLPLVLALHGAGGSENLFFDGYGRGAVVKLCADRGWLLVAPRLTGFGRLPTLPEMIAEVSRLYPVDGKRVFLVGHSMGAQAALAAAEQTPDQFAGLAALGGGRAVRKPERFQKLPVFVGIGDNDFALPGARALAGGLKKAEISGVEFREYKDVEHLVIVQVALKDVFQFFDHVARRY